MAAPTTPITTTTTSSTTPPPSNNLQQVKGLVQKDLTATTQFFLLQRSSLLIDNSVSLPEALENHLSDFVEAFQGSIPSQPSMRLTEDRSKLTSFRLCDVLTLDSLTEFCCRKLWIIHDNQNDRFDRYVQTLAFSLMEFFGRVPGKDVGSKETFDITRKTILDKRAEITKEFKTLSKNGELTSSNCESAIAIRALDKLVQFCTTVEMCMSDPAMGEKTWESFWESDFGKYVAVSYLIEIFKRDYQHLQQAPQDPLNKWAHTVLLGWIEELLLSSYPDLVEEIHTALQGEAKHCSSDQEAAQDTDAVRVLQMTATRCFRDYYPLHWKKYIQSLTTSTVNPEIERNILLRLLQDQKYGKKPSFESCLVDATPDLIKSDLTLEAVTPLHQKHPQVAAPLQSLVNETIDGIYFSRLWGKYITLLTQSYPRKPTAQEFSTIEKELIEAIKKPNIAKAIRDSFSELLKDSYLKSVELDDLTEMWRKKPVVPNSLQELVKESYDIVWGFRTFGASQAHNSVNTPHRIASNMMMFNFLAKGPQKRLPPPIDPVETIRQKLASMSTSGLITWYFGELQKKQNDLHIQATEKEINNRVSLSAKDVKTDTFSIVTMKVLHDKIAQTSLKNKQVILEALNKSIKSKLPTAPIADLGDFLDEMKNSPTNGWSPFAVTAHTRLLTSECNLYFTNLTKNPTFAAQVETKINKRFNLFAPEEKAISSLLDPLSAAELQALHLGISKAAALDEAPQKHLLRVLEQELLKKIEAMDHPKARQFIASLKANPEDPHDSSGKLYALAETHIEKCLRQKSTKELLTSYLQCRIAILQKPTLVDATDISLIEKILLTKNDLPSAMVKILSDKKIFTTFKLDYLTSLEQAFDTLFENASPLGNLKVLVQELIALRIWSLNRNELLNKMNSPSTFIRQIATLRYHSSYPSGQETDPVTIALICIDNPSAKDRLQELPLKSIRAACHSLSHLTSFSSCQASSIQDRLKALKILQENLSKPRIDPAVKQLGLLWKIYLPNLNESWASQTVEMDQMRQKLSADPSKTLLSFSYVLKDRAFLKTLSLPTLERLEKRYSPQVKTDFAHLFAILMREIIAVKVWEMSPKELQEATRSKNTFISCLATQRQRAMKLGTEKSTPTASDDLVTLALAIIFRQHKNPEASITDLESQIEKLMLNSTAAPDLHAISLLTLLSSGHKAIQDRLAAQLILKKHYDFRQLLQMPLSAFYQTYFEALLHHREDTITDCRRVLKKKGTPAKTQIEQAVNPLIEQWKGIIPEETLSSIAKKLLKP